MTGSTIERPDLQRALAESRLRRYDLLLVYRVDRLARSVRGLAQILEELDKAGVAFRSATEPFDTATAAGRMMVQMLGVFAEFERATIIDRVVAGMERKAAHGGWLGGSIPYGYRHTSKEDRTLVLDEAQAPVVPIIFDLYVNRRMGSSAIVDWLNENGYRTRRGRLWSFMSVLRLLRNEAYLGKVFFRSVYYPAAHPPLIEEATFERARRLLESRGEDVARRRADPSDYALSGRVTCGCGRSMVGAAAHGRSGRYRYYVCQSRVKFGRASACTARSIPADDLEDAVVGSLIQTFRRSDLLEQAWREATATTEAARPQTIEQLHAVDTDIHRTDDAVSRYLAAFENGTMPAGLCGSRLEALEERLVDLRGRRADLAARVEEVRRSPTAGDFGDLIGLVQRALAATDPRLQKPWIAALVADVRVEDRNSIFPRFRVPRPGSDCLTIAGPDVRESEAPASILGPRLSLQAIPLCEACGQPIPQDRARPGCRYCSDRCRKRGCRNT